MESTLYQAPASRSDIVDLLPPTEPTADRPTMAFLFLIQRERTEYTTTPATIPHKGPRTKVTLRATTRVMVHPMARDTSLLLLASALLMRRHDQAIPLPNAAPP